MKYVKMLGFAVVAAAALMALVGAGTASATVLCANNESASSCNEPYGAGTEISSSLVTGTKWKLKNELKTVECGKATISATTESAGGATETVKGSVKALTVEECNCEVKVLKTGTFEIHAISGTTNGTFTQTGAEITTSCSTAFGTVHCIYATEKTDLGTLTGGSPAKLDVNASVARLTTSFLCSAATWEATYEVTTPNPLYVATQDGEPTKLCAEAAFNCPEGQTYPESTSFIGTSTVGELILHYKAGNSFIECKKYKLRGVTSAREGTPLSAPGAGEFETCGFTAGGMGSCVVTMSIGGGAVAAIGNEKDGRWKLGTTILKISQCEQPNFGFCEFKETSPAITIRGGTAGTATMEANRTFTLFNQSQLNDCSGTITWKVTYVIGKEEGVGNLFVTN